MGGGANLDNANGDSEWETDVADVDDQDGGDWEADDANVDNQDGGKE